MANQQYKLNRWAGIFSRVGRQEILEQEIPGAGKGAAEEETYNFYGNDARAVDIKAHMRPRGLYKACKTLATGDLPHYQNAVLESAAYEIVGIWFKV